MSHDLPGSHSGASDEDLGSVLRVAEAILDGSPVDWNGRDAAVAGETARQLQVIQQLIDVHRQQDVPALASTTVSLPANSAEDSEEGEPWGPLILRERVGGGAFGEVFRAWDPALRHEVALKRLRLPEDALPSFRAAVLREGQLLARVKHPNVVVVHGACQVAGEVGIWTEFLHGRTLEQVVKDEGPMSAQEASVVGDCLCRAVAAVHAAGLVHRDVKASNVMREAGGRIVLVDFGAGIDGDVLAGWATTRMAGTPLYLAPEIFDGRSASKSSDVYSLGVLLFFLVSGTYPVAGRTLADIRAAHKAGRRRLLSDLRPELPGAFVRVVERATAPLPEDRYQSAGALLRDLTEGQVPGRDGAFSRWPIVAALLAATAGFWILGLLTSLAFNVTLGRVGRFADEGFFSYWLWGVRALVGPAVFMVITAYMAAAAAAIVRRLLRGRRTPRVLLDPRVRAKALLVAQVVLFAALCWRFADVFNAATSYLSTSSPDRFDVLKPDRAGERQFFAILFSLLAVGSGWSWYAHLRAAPRPQLEADRFLIATGLVVLVATLALLVTPYRIFWQNRFERVLFDSMRCYVIGVNSPDALLYCPDAPPPRTRVLPASDPRVQRSGVLESIFVP